jgi:hypothetical protein
MSESVKKFDPKLIAAMCVAFVNGLLQWGFEMTAPPPGMVEAAIYLLAQLWSVAIPDDKEE